MPRLFEPGSTASSAAGRGPFVAPDHGFTAVPADLALFTANGTMSEGFVQYSRVVCAESKTLTNGYVNVTVAGVTLTAAMMGVYKSGTLIGQTASQTTGWTSTGPKTMALTVEGGQSLTVAAGDVLVLAALANGATRPQLSRSVAGDSLLLNVLQADGNRRSAAGLGSKTALDSALPVTNASNAVYFMGVS